jgi:hypothetical protein
MPYICITGRMGGYFTTLNQLLRLLGVNNTGMILNEDTGEDEDGGCR